MKCLVIGYGSIGQRHARILQGMGNTVALLTKSEIAGWPVFQSVSQAVESWKPGYIVVANETSLHSNILEQLAELNYRGIVLVEKPLATNVDELGKIPTGQVYVGYTLRFHPLIQRMRLWACDQSLWTFTAYVGQYLPDWRPERDYRLSYSARTQDGGVIRDLSHELDYAQLITGHSERTLAAGGHLSSLEIESEDAATILAETERCRLLTIHVNYLDRLPSRWIVANGPKGTMKVDLIKGVLVEDNQETNIPIVRDSMIRAQHEAAMKGDTTCLCTLKEALCTMRWIDAAHESLKSGGWVNVKR